MGVEVQSPSPPPTRLRGKKSGYNLKEKKKKKTTLKQDFFPPSLTPSPSLWTVH